MKKMKSLLALNLVLLSTAICMPISRADDLPPPPPGLGLTTKRNLVAEAEKLRAHSVEQCQAKDLSGALQSISDCANLVANKDYISANKNIMIEAVCGQFDAVQHEYRSKRDWAGCERVVRKKIEAMELLKHTENNDYQSALQELEICLRAQNKSTDFSMLKAKMKPLKLEADKPLPELPNEPPPPPIEKD